MSQEHEPTVLEGVFGESEQHLEHLEQDLTKFSCHETRLDFFSRCFAEAANNLRNIRHL
jgi:hypothetical protein